MLKKHPPFLIMEINQTNDDSIDNEIFGWTEEEKKEKIKNANKVAIIITILGFILGTWTIHFGFFPKITIITAIIFAILCLVVLKYYNGIIIINPNKEKGYPSINFAVAIISIAIFGRAMSNYDIYDYSNVWAPTIFIVVVYVFILLKGNKEFNQKNIDDYKNILGLCFFLFFFSFGTVISLNCIFEKSNEYKIYHATIVSKSTPIEKMISYQFELTPWGNEKDTNKISVSSDIYYKSSPNDKVKIHLKKGLFDIPWFEVTD